MIEQMRQGRWAARRAPIAALAALTLLLSACGATTPKLPGGVYTNQQYHFSVSYPAGWQVNTSAQPGATAPLIVIITRSGTHQPPGSQISTLTIDVLAMSDASVAKSAAALSKNSALSKITFGGQPGYRATPTTQKGAGSDASASLTHSDYYVAYSGYLYQVSADALAGDGATLDTMAQSFKLLG